MKIYKSTIKIILSCPDDVNVSEEFIRQISQTFVFYYTPFTKIKRLLIKTCRVCNCSKDKDFRSQHFMAKVNDKYYPLDEDGRVLRLIDYLNCGNVLYLEYIISGSGGLGIETKNGIYYFYHIKECRHVPHIHAKYQGDEISVEILTLKTKGKFENIKRQKEAVQYVKEHRAELLDSYNKKTNGIHIDDFQVSDDGEIIFMN